MLELKNIVKDYVSGNNVTHALKGISVNFRKNEFVSILGASGCGKTTTLNIIGGLDRYTSGDLLIDGKSTKDYTDRDWDTYRNHSIGFIFQTYNLISHQNILKNVELALTISGVSKEERKQRAYDALKKVGLEGMEKKKPNQLSGGQCQRVAIARALINNPEILLADEPTGALDSETSIQIMDLLKEVAADRLVIMVTHNPDLAQKYSTRIVRMSDGLLVDDSMPFDGKDEETVKTIVNKGKKKKSSMSLWTSMGLSLSNLISKLRRTILVTIAGSIGIIGVSSVLAVSRGVKDYIAEMQNDMLSAYPLTIAETAVDYTSLMSGLSSQEVKEHFEFDPEHPEIGVDSMINYLMTTYRDVTKVKTNTIDDNLLAYIDGLPKDSAPVIKKNYDLDPTNNIFGNWLDDSMDYDIEKRTDKTSKAVNRTISFNGLTQRYISELKTVDDFEQYATFVDLFTNFMNELPNNEDYIKGQYDVLAGDLTTGTDDLILVVDQDTTLTDLLLAQMGVFNHEEFLKIAKRAIKENQYRNSAAYETDDVETRKDKFDAIKKETQFRETFKYEDLVNREFYYFPEDEIYQDSMKIADDEKTLSVTFGIVNGSTGEVEAFLYLTHQQFEFSIDETNSVTFNLLIGAYMHMAGDVLVTDNIAAVKDFLAPSTPTTEDYESVLYGKWTAFDSNELLGIIQVPTEEAMSYYTSLTPLFSFELGDKETGTNIFNDLSSFTPTYVVDEKPIEGQYYNADLDKTWLENLDSHHGRKMKISAILRLKDGKNFGCLSRGLYYTTAFAEQYMADALNSKVTNKLIDHISNSSTIGEEFKAYVTYEYFSDQTKGMVSDGYAPSLNGTLSSSFSSLFGVNGVSYEATNLLHLRSLSGLKPYRDTNEELKFGKIPTSIDIFPKSFEDKDIVTDYLDKWNSDEEITINVNGSDLTLKGNERDELTYTDTIQIIVTVINTLIDAITISLVVFTSLSLVVSCFMIAVITYISVVERIKEIGVIRSLGGRKGDVASLFVMETLLTGLFSGVFGIAITYVIQIILNAVLVAKFGIAIAHLTIGTAAIMIGVSVALSVISGLIPSQSAAHKDPVIALRSGE